VYDNILNKYTILFSTSRDDARTFLSVIIPVATQRTAKACRCTTRFWWWIGFENRNSIIFIEVFL